MTRPVSSANVTAAGSTGWVGEAFAGEALPGETLPGDALPGVCIDAAGSSAAVQSRTEKMRRVTVLAPNARSQTPRGSALPGAINGYCMVINVVSVVIARPAKASLYFANNS